MIACQGFKVFSRVVSALMLAGIVCAGYFAPDLPKNAEHRDAEYWKACLKDSSKFYDEQRYRSCPVTWWKSTACTG